MPYNLGWREYLNYINTQTFCEKRKKLRSSVKLALARIANMAPCVPSLPAMPQGALHRRS
jgi:hypothetical protein